MAKTAATRDQAAQNFRDHLNHLLARTLTQTPLVQFSTFDRRLNIAFRHGGAPHRALLATRFGAMALFIGQVLDFEDRPSGQLKLLTAEYKYTIGSAESNEPLLRWEYVRRRPAGAQTFWCRHHLQGEITLPLDRGVSLNDFHLPTGYVTLEEIIRFCIVDLGVAPLSSDWNNILDDSYRLFKDGFVSLPPAPQEPGGKRVRPPAKRKRKRKRRR